jgi:hypothetical protein
MRARKRCIGGCLRSLTLPYPSTIDVLRNEAQVQRPIENFDRLLELIGDASIVLLGEATHGTREFYRMRADICRHLIVAGIFGALEGRGSSGALPVRRLM